MQAVPYPYGGTLPLHLVNLLLEANNKLRASVLIRTW
jgi:hypothetical protein